MKWKVKWSPCFFLLVGLVSCEEVIDLDLGNADPRIIIEGVVTTDPGPYSVKISQSVDFGETNLFPAVTGAKVVITDDSGYSEILNEMDGGIYETKGLKGENGEKYTIGVSHEGEVYAASSIIPQTSIPINSISYEFVEESLFFEEGYYMTAFFSDPVDEVNFYRLKVFVNGKPYFFEINDKLVKDDNFWLVNDKFFNGKIIDYEFPHKLQLGDEVNIELHQVDEDTYNYYRTLVDLMEGGGMAPANPLTNWTNGALGYFGATSITYESIVIEEE